MLAFEGKMRRLACRELDVRRSEELARLDKRIDVDGLFGDPST